MKDDASYTEAGTTTRHLRPARMLKAMPAQARHAAETDKLSVFMDRITNDARRGRIQAAREGLLKVKAQMLAAQANHEGVTPGTGNYGDVTHTPTGYPRSVLDAFSVGADNVVRAFAAHDYRMALRAVDGLLARLRKFKPQS